MKRVIIINLEITNRLTTAERNKSNFALDSLQKFYVVSQPEMTSKFSKSSYLKPETIFIGIPIFQEPSIMKLEIGNFN